MGRRVFLILLCCVLLTGCGPRASRETEPPLRATAEPGTVPAETETLPAAAETIPQTFPAETDPPETEPQPESFLLSFVGDCTLGGEVKNAGAGYGFLKTVGDDYGYPFRNVLSYFENDDFTMVNLEGTLTDEGHPVEKKFRFRGPETYVNILTQGSIEAVSLANNHTMDYGQTGYANTKKVLEEAGVPYVERDSTRIITLDRGLTIGLYGAVYYRFDEEDIIAQLGALRDQADLVIFVPHWGTEICYQPTAEQIHLAHLAIDAGADLVYGSHPHVLQKMEQYGNGLIFYSMGNFAFGGNIYPRDLDTAIWQQEVLKDPDGTVRLGKTTLIPACVSSREDDRNNFQPTPYEEGSEGYERVLRKLRGE